MADFEADKTSGKGPTLVMVHPLNMNDTESDKKASLIVDVNGVTKTVSLLQKKGTLSYEYQLEVDKDILNIPGKGGTDTLVVTSRRRRMINSTPQGDWENVHVIAELVEGNPFTDYVVTFTDKTEKNLEVKINSKNITEQAISGILTIKQVGGLTKTVTVTQAAGEVTYSYRIDPAGTTLSVPKDQITNPWEGSVGATFTGYRAKLIEGTKVSEEVLPFKIPSIGETKVIDNGGIAVSYWFTDYGSIANNYQASFSATSHMRKNAGIYFQAFSASWECQFNDGGTYQINTLLMLQLV